MTDRLLRLPAVEETIGLRKSKIYEMIGKGEFPRPVKLGTGHVNAWAASEINAWIAAQLAEREAINA